jgi:hypothetical protein
MSGMFQVTTEVYLEMGQGEGHGISMSWLYLHRGNKIYPGVICIDKIRDFKIALFIVEVVLKYVS